MKYTISLAKNHSAHDSCYIYICWMRMEKVKILYKEKATEICFASNFEFIIYLSAISHGKCELTH